MNDTKMGLRTSDTVSLCIQIAIDKMQLCLLSIAYACPYHNPIATMGNSVHIVDISKLLATHDTIHAVCHLPGTVKTRLIREEHTSPVGQWPSKLSIYLLKSVTTPNCSQVKTLVRMTSTQMSFPETVCAQCRNSSVVQPHSFTSCPLAGLRQSRKVKQLHVEVLGWLGYTWSAVNRSVERTAKLSKTTLEEAYGREMNIQFSGKGSGGHSCSQHANSTLLQNLRHL